MLITDETKTMLNISDYLNKRMTRTAMGGKRRNIIKA